MNIIDSKISKPKKQALEAIVVVCEFSCLGHASQVRSLKLCFIFGLKPNLKLNLI